MADVSSPSSSAAIIPPPPGGGGGGATTGASAVSSSSSSAGYHQHEADERIAARHAVSLADEKWRSLCTQHASTFVASEIRTASVRSALRSLLGEIVRETGPSVWRVGRALDPDYVVGEGKDDDDDDDGDDDGPIRPASVLLADLAEKHRLRRRTLMQHSSLLELLELPSLMDACVRSSLYEDALSIAGFANELERRHLASSSSSSPSPDGNKVVAEGKNSQSQQQQQQQQGKGDVVAGVVTEIRRREADLRRMLVHRLRNDVTMPQCLEVVTALRRLNGVELERRNGGGGGGGGSVVGGGGRRGGGDVDLEGVHAAMETRLQVDFLEARDAWLEGGMVKVGSAQAAAAAAAAAASSSSSSAGDGRVGEQPGSSQSARAEQILDGIERYRTRCFEIVTQFLAIFRGSFAPSPSSSPNGGRRDHSSSLLSMWTARRVQTFLTGLSADAVAHVHDTATLRDALDAASFFASSMGRVGADFQPLLAPVFEPRLAAMVAGRWDEGLSSMMETLKACRDAGVAGPLFGAEMSSPSSAGDGSLRDGTMTDDADMMRSSRTPAPPRRLLALPPLARFLNAYLGGLNELRRCLLPGAFPAVRAAKAKLVDEARMALQANERAVLTPGLRGEAARLREAASRMKAEFEGCLEPYMASCLEVALGSVDHAMEEARAAAALAEKKARVEAEKERVEKEALEKAKAKKEAADKAKAESEALERAKAAAEAEALEEVKAKAAQENKMRIEEDDVGHSSQSEVAPAEAQQAEPDLFEDDDDMYGSD